MIAGIINRDILLELQVSSETKAAEGDGAEDEEESEGHTHHGDNEGYLLVERDSWCSGSYGCVRSANYICCQGSSGWNCTKIVLIIKRAIPIASSVSTLPLYQE